MIIFFNCKIFETEDLDIQSILAKILIHLMNGGYQNHFIDTQNISEIFFDEQNQYTFNKNKRNIQ